MTKLIKTAAALALGATLVTSAVVPTDASAASKYKVKNGKLVVAKTGKTVTGFKTFNKIVYKNGVKFNGLKGSVYYKAGKKATGTYKGAYYVNGAKKVTTGTYNKAYYVKGVKKVTTGLYASKYYKAGKLATGTYKGAYYVNGVKKVTTGTYNKAYYVKGVKKVATGTYNKAYYVNGKKVVTSGVYDGKLYTDGKLNVGLKLVDGDLYNGADLNEGLVEFDEKIYDGAELADGTFDYQGKEEAIEKGIKVGAKVASVEAINGTTLEVKFNKAVDKASATAVTGTTANAVKIDGATLSAPTLSEDGRTLTLTYVLDSGVTEFKDATATVLPVVTKADAKVSTPKFVKVINFKDTEAPAIKEVKTVNKANKKVDATITFNKALATIGAVSVDGIVDATIQLSADKKSIVIAGIDAGSTKEVVINNLVDALGNKTESVSTTIVTSEDTTAPTAVLTTDGTNIKVKFSEEVVTTNVTVTANSTTTLALGAIDADGFYTIDASSLLTGTETFLKDVKFVVAGVTDLAGNPTAKDIEYTTTIQKASTVAAKYVSATVAADAKTITVNYDKEVELPTADATFTYTYTDEEGVLHKAADQTFTAAKADAKLSDDKKSVIYTIPAGTTLANGSYTFTFGENTFTSAISVTAPVAPVTATVTATVTSVASNVITLTYNEVMDDSAKSVSNYKLAGKALPAGTTINFVGSKATVEITLPLGTVDKDGARTLEISNVVAKSGNTLQAVTAPLTVTLTDNVAPTTTGVAAVSTSQLAVVSFSEQLKALANGTAVTGLTVKVNGVVLDSTKFTASVNAEGKLELAIVAPATLALTDKVTVELDAKTTNLTDANGNVAIVK